MADQAGKGSAPRNCFSQDFRDGHDLALGFEIPVGQPLPPGEPPSEWRCKRCGWQTPRSSLIPPEDMPLCRQPQYQPRTSWPYGMIYGDCGGEFEIVYQ